MNGRVPSLAHTNVVALDGGLWGPETEADILIPPPSTFSGPRSLNLNLGVLENVRLLLESPLGLDSQFGRHCEVSVHREMLIG